MSWGLVLSVPLIETLPADPDKGTGGLASFSFETLSVFVSHTHLGAHPGRN